MDILRQSWQAMDSRTRVEASASLFGSTLRTVTDDGTPVTRVRTRSHETTTEDIAALRSLTTPAEKEVGYAPTSHAPTTTRNSLLPTTNSAILTHHTNI